MDALPHCFLLLHEDQDVRWGAELAHTKTEEKENQQLRLAADSQPGKQPDPYNDRGTQAEQEQREHTHRYNNSNSKWSLTG